MATTTTAVFASPIRAGAANPTCSRASITPRPKASTRATWSSGGRSFPTARSAGASGKAVTGTMTAVTGTMTAATGTVTAEGTEAQTENGALVSAKRAWRAWVRSDHGERYQDLDAAKNGEYRCWRSSTNESTIGKVGEFLTGQYRKRCQVWATPCLGERHTLDGDKDDRE